MFACARETERAALKASGLAFDVPGNIPIVSDTTRRADLQSRWLWILKCMSGG
jgi:hypothetical protein